MPKLCSLIVGVLTNGPSYFIYPGHFDRHYRKVVQEPHQYGLPYDDLTLRTSDGVKLHAYLLLQRGLGADDDDDDDEAGMRKYASSRPTVLILHGNGGNVGIWLPHAKQFYRRMKCNVLMLEYRGYGKSKGYPSEYGIRIDAQLALDYILTHECLSQTPIIIYGQSFGGAVAIDLASRNPSRIQALIIENTYLSLRALIPHRAPLAAPFARLLVRRQRWDSASKVCALPGAVDVLLLSGLRDDIVPPAQMQALWQLVRERVSGIWRRCRFAEFADGGHNNTSCQPGYWGTIAAFIEDI